MDDDLGPRLVEEALYVRLVRQIALRLAHDDDVAASVACESLDDMASKETAAAGDEDAFIRELHARVRVCRPMTSTSMWVRRKQSSASAGRSTIGSFSLKDVFSSMGTPLTRSNALIRFQYRGFECGLTVCSRPEPST